MVQEGGGILCHNRLEMANHESGPGPHSLVRRPSRNAANTTVTLEVFDNEVVPPTLAISHILHVATDVEAERPRVAYLCRFYAFEKSVRLDPNSSGRGVRRFKTALHQRIERENISSFPTRVKRSDAREIESFYQQYYEEYVRSLDKGQQGDRTQLAKAYQTVGVLFEVLSAVNKNEKNEEVPPEIIAASRNVQEMNGIYAPCYILPLDAAGTSQPIMQFDEVKAAVSPIRNTKGLTWPTGFEQSRQRTGDLDLLDWLRAMFGFQSDTVKNQREHLLSLLSKNHIRLVAKPDPLTKLDERAVNAVIDKTFKNYKNWCNLGRKHSLRLPQGQQEMQQRKILYMGLYYLIVGEAANVRFMPECIGYIFHNMAYELHGLLAGNFSIVTGENMKPLSGGDDKAFLRRVITPIYHVIEKALIIVAWKGTSPLDIFRKKDILHNVSSGFPGRMVMIMFLLTIFFFDPVISASNEMFASNEIPASNGASKYLGLYLIIIIQICCLLPFLTMCMVIGSNKSSRKKARTSSTTSGDGSTSTTSGDGSTSTTSGDGSVPPNWSGLPGDIVLSIAGILSANNKDFRQFTGVCHEWRRITVERFRPLFKCRSPWLMMTAASKDSGIPRWKCGWRYFYDGNNVKLVHLHLPSINRRSRCWGSNFGIMLLQHVGENNKLCLLNPITGCGPNLPTFDQRQVIVHAVIGLHAREISVLLTMEGNTNLLYARVGRSDKWIRFSTTFEVECTLVHENKLYAVDSDGKISSSSIDNTNRGNFLEDLSCAPENLKQFISDPNELRSTYLLTIGGMVTLIVRYFRKNKDSITYQTRYFAIFELTLAEKWKKVSSVGNYSIFLGKNSFAVKCPDYKGGCIYYTQDFKQFLAKVKMVDHDEGVFNVKKRTFGEFPYKGPGMLPIKPSIWIMPWPFRVTPVVGFS